MASSVYLIDTTAYPTTSNLYLSGAGTPWNGSGTPWTAVGTSPYTLSANDTTGGIWTPQAPPRTDILSGGPPFALGSAPVYRGYGNVECEIGVQMYATNDDNAVDLLDRLRRVLSAGMAVPAAELVVAPNSATNAVRYLVVGGTVQEAAAYLTSEANNPTRIIRAVLRVALRPFGIIAGSGYETINNASSMSNAGSGSPSNLVAFGAGRGDLVAEGSPINVALTTTGTTWSMGRTYVASARGRVLDVASAGTLTTSSTSGAYAAGTTFDPSAYAPYPKLVIAVFVHASQSSNAEFRVIVQPSTIVDYTTTGSELLISPWLGHAGTSGYATIRYAGIVDLDLVRRAGLTQLRPFIHYRSTNGSSASVIYTSLQLVYAHSLAVINPTGASIFMRTLNIDTHRAGRPIAPTAYASVVASDASTSVRSVDMRGSPPLYYSGASLWAVGTYAGENSYLTTRTFTATVTHAPQYHTLRGGSL